MLNAVKTHQTSLSDYMLFSTIAKDKDAASLVTFMQAVHDGGEIGIRCYLIGTDEKQICLKAKKANPQDKIRFLIQWSDNTTELLFETPWGEE